MSEEVVLSITPGGTVTDGAGEVPVLISIKPPAGTGRTPSDICCVIDTSWSMSMEAAVQAASGKSESNGLSMLDVAKHAVRTVIRTLGPADRVAIVEFCREAKVVFPLTEMNEEGQKNAEAKLDGITFGNGTNLWNGLEAGLRALKSKAAPDRFGHIMLLTDGETENRDTVMKNLTAYKDSNEGLPGTISAFGFGYEIDSVLLVEIANFSDGTYAFIPDAGFVGTIFVNSMSNLLVTFAKSVRLSLQADGGADILAVEGRWDCKKDSDDVFSVNIGTIQYGQTKDIVVKMKFVVDIGAAEPFLFASLDYMLRTRTDASRCEASAKPTDAPSADLVNSHCFRTKFVNTLAEVAEAAKLDDKKTVPEENLKRAQSLITETGAAIASSIGATSEASVGPLLEDVRGQCLEAISRMDYWKKWGRHYTPSVMFAHKLQQCNNFKDPGVQVYGGQLFKELQNTADNAFDSLPAPKITPAMYRYLGDGKVIKNPDYTTGHTGSSAGASPAATPANMAAYNDRFAG